jgi:pimeloyl-ACP methyl ester carboxylesterase
MIHNRDSTVTIDGVRLRFRSWGADDRPSIVLLHASGCHLGWWSEVAPALADEFHVVALDLRGHGGSDASPTGDYDFDAHVRDLDGVIDALDLHDVIVVGHSLGGYVGLKYATTSPRRLRGLVIADMLCSLDGEALDRLHQAAQRPQPVFATREEAVEKFRLQPPETAAAEAIIRSLAEHAVGQTSDGKWTFRFDRRALRHSPVNAWQLLDKVDCPVLIVRGEKSTLMPTENVQRLVKGLKKSAAVDLPGAYHNLMLDNPAGFADAVRVFAHQLNRENTVW